MEMKTSITEPLFNIFKEKCSRSQDFDLLCSIHLRENDHTRILRDILNQEIQGKKMYLESFVSKVLQLDIKNVSSCECIDQQPATGNQKNSKGYVDLLIKSDDLNIIIENKVCGASDTNGQLLRYCLSYCSDQQITDIGLKLEDKDCNNSGFIQAHIYYLTCDGQKEPSKESAGDSGLVKQTWYHAINYEKDILPWLENDVLPNIPYKSDGDMIKGILLYINYLNTLVGHGSNNDSSIWRDFSISNLYDALQADTSSKTGEETDEDNVLYRKYRSSLKLAIENKLNQIVSDINNEWSIHFAPSFIQLYKKNWSWRFKNRICPIHFELLNYKTNPNWTFHIESSEDDRKNFSSEIEKIKTALSDKNKPSIFDLKSDKESLKKYFNSVIYSISQYQSLKEFENVFFKQVPDSSK